MHKCECQLIHSYSYILQTNAYIFKLQNLLVIEVFLNCTKLETIAIKVYAGRAKEI